MKNLVEKLIIGFLINSALCCFASEPCPEFLNEWTDCKVDKDCAIELDACYFVSAYQKKYLQEVQVYNECLRPMIKCAAPPVEDKEKKFVKCQNNKCLATTR